MASAEPPDGLRGQNSATSKQENMINSKIFLYSIQILWNEVNTIKLKQIPTLFNDMQIFYIQPTLFKVAPVSVYLVLSCYKNKHLFIGLSKVAGKL